MKKHKVLLYCNTDTLVNCSKTAFDHIVNEYFEDSFKIDDRLWCLTIEKYDMTSMLGAMEDAFYDYFRDLTNDKSIIVLTEISDTAMYVLPKNADKFFSQV